jgi:hypothetical protein
MLSQTMIQPSFWVSTGITTKKVRDIYLFKFTDELQDRLDRLTEKRKLNQLSMDEEAELNSILELDRIFTLANAKLIDEPREN